MYKSNNQKKISNISGNKGRSLKETSLIMMILRYTLISKPRLLNLMLSNLIVRWPTGAAIVRPPNAECAQGIGACWEKLPKIVKITLLQFNYEFRYGFFFTV